MRGIDLELLRGELVVLLGPSGSGKSTLLNILGGLGARADHFPSELSGGEQQRVAIARALDLQTGILTLQALQDRLAAYGGMEPFGRERMVSARFLTEELARLVATERANIGLLKAFGHSNLAVARHYAGIGLVLGMALGHVFWEWMSSIYRAVYRLPALPFQTDGTTWALALGVGLAAYARSALFVLATVAVCAAWVRRQVDRVDLVASLKSRE